MPQAVSASGGMASNSDSRATVPAGATDFTRKGFDACTAPSAATMATWLRLSPYRAVGVYIGGSDRACAQPALTASCGRRRWVWGHWAVHHSPLVSPAG